MQAGEIIRKQKAYKNRIKGHHDRVILLHSPEGITGTFIISGSADGRIRVWDL